MIGTDIVYAKKLLTEGQLVAIPTETVYGLAANALNELAVNQIFEVKKRPKHNPLILHVASLSQMAAYTTGIPDMAYQLMAHFSPGPLTVLLPKSQRVPGIVTAGLSHVAIRIPAHPLLLELLRDADFPIAAPSANPFGYISPTTAEHVAKILGENIRYILDGGPCDKGVESTIVSFERDHVTILRKGAIAVEQIERVVGKVKVSEEKAVLAPGMMPGHYSPKTPFYIGHDVDTLINSLNSKNLGLITYNDYSDSISGSNQILLTANSNMDEAAKNLYAAMHEMESRDYEAIVARTFPETGVGAAINDRLKRASFNTKNKKA